jgi:F1F0 ATPase subunit 2
MMMTTHDALSLLLAWLAGGALGTFFFGGLWWTVRRALAASNPAMWILPSALLRTGVALTAFYFVASADWQRLLACLAGFVMARQIVVRLTREAPHAP